MSGWAHVGDPIFDDKWEAPENSDKILFGEAYARKWQQIVKDSHRYAQHGFWTVYWNPTERRSFCFDSRALGIRSEDAIADPYVWLPKRGEGVILNSPGCALKDLVRKVREYAKKGLVYLEEEAHEWLSEILQEKKSEITERSIRARGLISTMMEKENRAKLENMYTRFDNVDDVSFPKECPLYPSANQISEAVCYVLCLSWMHRKSDNVGTLGVMLHKQAEPMRDRSLPWLRYASNSAYATMLFSSIKNRVFGVADLLISRANFWKKLPQQSKYPSLTIEDNADNAHFDRTLRVAYLQDFKTSNDERTERRTATLATTDPTALSLSSMPNVAATIGYSGSLYLDSFHDVIRIRGHAIIGGVELDESELDDSPLTLAMRTGEIGLAQRLMDLGATIDKFVRYDDLQRFSAAFLSRLLIDMCKAEAAGGGREQSDLSKQLKEQVRVIMDHIKQYPIQDLESTKLGDHPFYAAVEAGSLSMVEAFLTDPYNSYFIDAIKIDKKSVTAQLKTKSMKEKSSREKYWSFGLAGISARSDQRANGSDLAPVASHMDMVGVGSGAIGNVVSAGGVYKFGKDNHGWTLLSKAVYLGHYAIVKKLLDADAAPVYSTVLETRRSDEFTSKTSRFVSRIVGHIMASGGRMHGSAIPHAFSMALLRVQRQQMLRSSIELCGTENPILSAERDNGNKKLELAQDVLTLLQKTESVTLLRYEWIIGYVVKLSSVYVLFLVLFTFAVVKTSNITPAKQEFNTLASAVTQGDGSFMTMAGPDDVWAFLSGAMVDGLYPAGYENGWLDEHNQLIGGISLTQTRKDRQCKIAIGKVWQKLKPLGARTASTRSCYHLNNASTDHTLHITLSGKDANATAATIAALQASNWIDGATEVIGIDYVIGNICYTIVMMKFWINHNHNHSHNRNDWIFLKNRNSHIIRRECAGQLDAAGPPADLFLAHRSPQPRGRLRRSPHHSAEWLHFAGLLDHLAHRHICGINLQ